MSEASASTVSTLSTIRVRVRRTVMGRGYDMVERNRRSEPITVQSGYSICGQWVTSLFKLTFAELFAKRNLKLNGKVRS